MNIEREQLIAALSRARDPRGMKTHEVAASLQADEKSRHRIRKLLADLVDEGVLEKAEGSRYRPVGWKPTLPAVPTVAASVGAAKLPVPAGTVAGRLRVHPAGYGFVLREDGEEDLFVAARNRGAAMDGDRVAVATWPGFKGTEGRVVSVLARGRARVTGIFRGDKAHAWLAPDDPRIQGRVALVGDQHGPGFGMARDGQAIVAEITSYPTAPDDPLAARLIAVLGDPDDPRTEVAKTIAAAEIPDAFPEDVAQAGERAPTEVNDADRADRADLRGQHFLTIDPETARDFDDAVCVEDGPSPSLTRLWVAVADVSHYVREGTPLDREAILRGVSVYLPDRAIPMLPHPLSAGICSLNPEVDRLAMVARLDIDGGGNVVEEQMMAAVIRSRARLDYAGVAAALGGDLRGPRARYEEHLPHLRRLQELSHRLRALRTERGSLDFEIPEAQVILDEDDPLRVRDVRKSRGNPEVKEAYRIIEDCMLAANEAVARFFHRRELDTLWRVHDLPKQERLEEFAQLAESFGVKFSAEEGRSPKKVREFLQSIAGKPMERALSFLLLRSLKQAVYDTVNVGHFGLAAPDYLHFTSPIRRYPDLVVHRLLKNQLKAEGQPAGGVTYAAPPSRASLQATAVQCSSHERRAMEAEREVVDMYRAFLMRDHVDERYVGTIVGVTGFGLFVEIDAPFVEGLIKRETLGHDLEIDARTNRLVAGRSGHSYALGDKVTVRIESVSVARRKIDMILEDHQETAPRAPRPMGRGKGHGDKRDAKPSGKRDGKRPPPRASDKDRRRERKDRDDRSKRRKK